MDDAIVHDHLPKAPWLDPAAWRLPGVQPLPPQDWLIRDEVFARQMALRDHLIAQRPNEVHAILPAAHDAAVECLDTGIAHMKSDQAYVFEGKSATRPDGMRIPINWETPLITLGRLQQADICLLQDGRSGHILTGAILCFPAQWTLAEKLGHPLGRIHKPVQGYAGDIEKRVQRLFDAIRPGQVLWRANALLYDAPNLFTPKREAEKTERRAKKSNRFVRSERQTLRRLPESRAVVFAIHTYMIPVDRLTSTQRNALDLLP